MRNNKRENRIDFRDQILKNNIKSIFLLIIVFFVFGILIFFIGQAMGYDIFIVSFFAIILSLVYILITYNLSDKIALFSVNAKEADRVQYKRLYDSVEKISIASGLPMPKVYVMKGNQINAFATGKNPNKAKICVTEGALKKLNDDELEGVIGHEFSHIGNYDIRFITIVAVVVGAVSIFSELFLRSLWYRDNNENKNILLVFLAIILAIIAPIIVKLVQLSISRKREYMADAGSVQFTRYPKGLINALKKIQYDSEKLNVPGAISPMFFSETKKERFLELFQTHPTITKRINVLERM